MDTVIYTPSNIPIPALYYTGDDFTYYEASGTDDDFLAEFPGAILLESSTKRYNCHGFAWSKIEGGLEVWLTGSYDSAVYHYGLLPYFYGSNPSYIEIEDQTEATKILYEWMPSPNNFSHSAVASNNTDTVISKWAYGPLVKHHIQDQPWFEASDSIRYFKLMVQDIEGDTSICGPELYSINDITNTLNASWTTSTKLAIVSGSQSLNIYVEPSSSTVYGYDEYVEAIVSTVYEDLDEGEDVVVVIDTLRKEGLHVSNPPSNVQIHIPVEPIYGEVEAMVWASSDPGDESYDWQVSGGTIISETGSEMTLIADCPSRRGITIGVKAINDCGESSWIYKNVDVDCNVLY